MRLKALSTILPILLVILAASSAFAQDGETPQPLPYTVTTPVPMPTLQVITPMPPYDMMTVTATAADRKTLVADLYVIDSARPTLLLLHQLYTDRHSWEQQVLPALLWADYNVLAVDVRGSGQTGGFVDWNKAVQDVQVWFDWLRANNLNAVITMGSSMGSALALVGCGNDPLCLGVIAISPGWNYYGVNVEETFSTLLDTRPALIVYAQNDYWPAVGIPQMLEVATNDVQVVKLPGNAHGMDLFIRVDTPLPQILEWLAAHFG